LTAVEGMALSRVGNVAGGAGTFNRFTRTTIIMIAASMPATSFMTVPEDCVVFHLFDESASRGGHLCFVALRFRLRGRD